MALEIAVSFPPDLQVSAHLYVCSLVYLCASFSVPHSLCICYWPGIYNCTLRYMY